MNYVTRNIGNLMKTSSINVGGPTTQVQWRGRRVKVTGTLEQALGLMQRKMTSSGMERLIRRQANHHVTDSEKRVLARKNLERKIRSQDLGRKLRSILLQKARRNPCYTS
ncbi:hypothetical protein QJS10_CPB12g00263 [Acorus calamus]|uniref:Ribosomal protein S21 n=1 Tax=Acorus calamus TaxID=4465 RepID=A0AAV9DJS8_ACOCL|nr:hypothetical protein QJS10_CPB12g00263 [Acorus calamus]